MLPDTRHVEATAGSIGGSLAIGVKRYGSY
jgi:hypothetical protein